MTSGRVCRRKKIAENRLKGKARYKRRRDGVGREAPERSQMHREGQLTQAKQDECDQDHITAHPGPARAPAVSSNHGCSRPGTCFLDRDSALRGKKITPFD